LQGYEKNQLKPTVKKLTEMLSAKKSNQIFIILAKYPLWCHEWAVPISVSLCQGPHMKVAAVASRWQRVGDLIGHNPEAIISCCMTNYNIQSKTESS